MRRIIIVAALLLLLTCSPAYGRGGRGGGSRGGSRGRGSSRRGSSPRRGSPYERKTSKESESKPVQHPPRLPPPQKEVAAKPSAPHLPDSGGNPVQPSAPRLPSQSSPNQQPPYNPNYGNPPHPAQGQGAPPPYPGPNQAPPPYPGGVNAAPPPYPGINQRPPPYPGINQGGSAPYPQQPGVGSAPYPRQPGSPNAPYPQQPGMPNAPYPRQPGSAPYPQQPNMPNAPYPRQPGSAPYPRQPGGAPYPQQPGMNYGPPPVYAQQSGLPIGGNPYVKPYKKKGFLGQIMSVGKSGSSGLKSPKYAGAHGIPVTGKHGISPAMYPIMPMVMKSKPKFFSPSFGRPSFIFLPIFGSPFGHWHHHHRHYDIDREDYRGFCRRPLTPKNGTLECNATELGAKCRASCNEGYRFSDNATYKENECWHVGGIWRPTRNFPQCEPICSSKCQNGGKCAGADSCSCPPSYRGSTCEYHFLNCDVRKLAGEQSSKIGWSCSHAKNETLCKIRCREDSEQFEGEPDKQKEYHCSIQGDWSPASLPKCVPVVNKDDEPSDSGKDSKSESAVTPLTDLTPETA